MKLGRGKARATLIEYESASPVLQELADTLQADRAGVRDQIVLAGERVARTLSLAENPFGVTHNEVRVVDVASLLRVGPRLELEIAPKFLGTQWKYWREDFFFIAMLSRHGRLLANERLGSTTGERGDLATLVARAIVSMFWDNYRRPLRTYRQEHIVDFVVDGDVEPEDIICPPADGYAQRLVSYDRRNVFNSAILAAVQALLPEIREPQTRRQLGRVAGILAPQRPLRHIHHRNVPSRSRRWQSLHDLSVDVLRGFGVTYESASIMAPGFVLDTWRVWEDLLTVALRLSWGSGKVNVQRSVALGTRMVLGADGKAHSRTAWVTPDLELSGGGDGLLIDSKYKGRIGESKNRVSEADLYEALAFASASKRKRVILLYPAVARTPSPQPVGTTTIFERIVVGDTAVIAGEVEVRGISKAGGLRRFADTIGKAMTFLAEAESPRQ